MYRIYAQVVIAVLLFLTACSEPPTTENTKTAESSGPATPVLAKKAFNEMYKQAYSWSHDLVPLKLESKDLPGIKNEGGSAGMWSATFGSFGKHQAVEITYAVAAHPPDIYKGITVGRAIPWSGPSRDATPFQPSDLGVDSDVVYKTALAQADPWLKKNPDKQVSLQLGNNPIRFSTPVWYVLWGDNKSGYSVFVNSKTGEVAKPGK
jgi:hypothetical protein